MLTKAEKKWLKDREKKTSKHLLRNGYYCKWCGQRNSKNGCVGEDIAAHVDWNGENYTYSCPTYPGDYKDAAEFEALVAIDAAAWTILTHDNLQEVERDIRFKPMCIAVSRIEVEEFLESGKTWKQWQEERNDTEWDDFTIDKEA